MQTIEKSIVQYRLLQLIKDIVYNTKDSKICKYCLLYTILHVFEDLELNKPLINKLEKVISIPSEEAFEQLFVDYQVH